MVLEVRIRKKNISINIYFLVMLMLMAARYVFRINVPSPAFLLTAAIPILFGSTSEKLACAMSFIPFSVAFQYKYALLILVAVLLLTNRWRIKSSAVLLLVVLMMVWEFLHIGFGYFSITEGFRGFAELLFLGTLVMIDIGEPDYRLIVRSLSTSVVAVCVIMFIMQLQKYNYSLPAVFSRSAASWRFGQSNMSDGRFALNFNANNLGFICNMSACGMLLLRKRDDQKKMDLILAICSMIFALMTLSRAAIICLLMILAAYVVDRESKVSKRYTGPLGMVLMVGIAIALIYRFTPSVFANILERFQRKDVWNGRTSLFVQYLQFAFSSPLYLLFGIGMQGIYEKVAPVMPVRDVPHNGLLEVLVAWGIPGLVIMIVWLWLIIKLSKVYSRGKRELYQFAPLLLTFVFTSSGQLLTSSRAILALSFSYICLCMASGRHRTGESAQERETAERV